MQDMDRRKFAKLMVAMMGGAAATTAGALVSPRLAEAAQEDAVRVGWLRLACTAQSFVAAGLHYGKSEHLKMTHRLFSAGAEAIEGVSAGALDTAYLGTTPAIGAAYHGIPVKMYAGGHQRGMGLVVLENSRIRSIEDLKGKTISTLGRGSVPDMQLRVTAREHGLDPNRDFSLVTLPSPDAVNALGDGSVAALMNCPEWPQVALTRFKGSRFVVTDINDTLWHGRHTQCVVVIADNRFAQANPVALKKFLRIHVRATRALVDDPKECAKIIAKYEGSPPEATELALSQMHLTPVPSVDSLVKWRDKMHEFGFIKGKIQISELVDLVPLRHALAEAGEKQWLADLDQEMQVLEKFKKEGA